MKFFVVLAFCLAVASATPFPQNDESLVSNGRTAARGQFPYMVGLEVRMTPSDAAWCGGSLINPEWILTAAHCCQVVHSITAYIGGTVRARAEATRSIGRSQIVMHDSFDPQYLNYDIALINIIAVPLSSNIGIVKLPAGNSLYENSYAILTGWGHTGDSSRSIPDNLQYGRMPVVANSHCLSYYGSRKVNAHTLCVATPNLISSCPGDSGGPLVLEQSDRAGFKVQIGISSHGSESGCEKGHPTVFTRVSSYLDWIREYSGVRP